MKKCFVFAGGFYDGFYDEIEKGDLLIGADRGYEYIFKENLKADYIIGDFDSAEKPNFDRKIVLPKEKDMTDSFAAVDLAYKKGYRKVILYGGLGGRISHSMANIKIAHYFKKKGLDLIIKNKNQRLFVIDGNFKEQKYIDNLYVSLFSLSGDIKNLSLKNLKYELNNYYLNSFDHIGVSNETTGKAFEISFDNGYLLVIYEKKNTYL